GTRRSRWSGPRTRQYPRRGRARVPCQYPSRRASQFGRDGASLDAMRAAIFNEPGSITIGERRDPVVAEPTDAVVRVVLACVCGSDLWYYRGDSPFEPGPIGHEFIGVVEDAGADVRNVAKGELVICPFAFS